MTEQAPKWVLTRIFLPHLPHPPHPKTAATDPAAMSPSDPLSGQCVRVNPVRLIVIGIVGCGLSLYFRAAHDELLRKKDRGDPHWKDGLPGEAGAWKLMLPTSVAIVLVGVITLIAEAIS